MGTAHVTWWRLKEFAFLRNSWNVMKKKFRTSYRRSLQVMNLGPIMTLRTKGSPWNTAIRIHLSRKNSKHRPRLERSCWRFSEFGTCCSCRLSWKRNNNKLSTLHWNYYCIKKKNRTDGNKKWNTSSTWRQASHKCNNRCNSTPDFQCCCIHRIAQIWLQVISTCSQN
jgi:hypothetical protein